VKLSEVLVANTTNTRTRNAASRIRSTALAPRCLEGGCFCYSRPLISCVARTFLKSLASFLLFVSSEGLVDFVRTRLVLSPRACRGGCGRMDYGMANCFSLPVGAGCFQRPGCYTRLLHTPKLKQYGTQDRYDMCLTISGNRPPPITSPVATLEASRRRRCWRYARPPVLPPLLLQAALCCAKPLRCTR
jgi:hypothetical protein